MFLGLEVIPDECGARSLSRNVGDLIKDLALVDIFETRHHIGLIKHLLLFQDELLQRLFCRLENALVFVLPFSNLRMLELRVLLVIERQAINLHLHGTDVFHIELKALFVSLGIVVLLLIFTPIAYGSLEDIKGGCTKTGRETRAIPYSLLLDSVNLSCPPILLH